MLVEAKELHPDGYALAVYDPPADGLPWLVVCIGPSGRLMTTVACSTADEARSKVVETLKHLVVNPINVRTQCH